MNSFSGLLELHAAIDAMFAEHQYALLHFDFALALERLGRHEEMLLAHMRDEEELLFPVYSERATIETGGDVGLFLNEHVKMRQHVDLFKETTESLISHAEPEPTLIKLLDRESFYKKLCSHHDMREGRLLYPALDEVTTKRERSELFERLVTRPKYDGEAR